MDEITKQESEGMQANEEIIYCHVGHCRDYGYHLPCCGRSADNVSHSAGDTGGGVFYNRSHIPGSGKIADKRQNH
jgi:hypothetical protein